VSSSPASRRCSGSRRHSITSSRALGDVAIVLAFTGLRWEEAVAVLITSVNLGGQSMVIDRTASESGGRRDIREDMKTRAAVRTVMIPDIAMPAVRRLVDRGDRAVNAATARSTND
jgi:hypothetical protein